jgi:hypothetical protein
MSIKLSNNNIKENASVGTVIGTFSLSLLAKVVGIEDQVQVQYTLKTNPYNTFAINGSDLILNSSLNYTIKKKWLIVVSATNSSGLNISQVFTINVKFVPQPTGVGILDYSLLDGSPVNSLVGQLVTEDPDSYDTFTYKLVSGEGSTDNKSFKIADTNGLYTAVDINILTQSIYSIRIRSTDTIGLSVEQILVLTVLIPIQYEPVLSTLKNTPKVINLAPSTFDTFPILFQIVQTPEYGTLVQTSSNTFTYTSNQNGLDFIQFNGEVITPLGEIFYTEYITIELINYSTSDVSSITKIQGTYTFDNISYDGDNWKFGTFTSDSPFIQYSYNGYGPDGVWSPPVPQNLVVSTQLGTMRFIHSVASGDDINGMTGDGDGIAFDGPN